MRIKPMTPLGLAFVFSVLLAGWASAANGLQPSSNHGGTLTASTDKHDAESSSPSSSQSAGHEKAGTSTTQSTDAGQDGGQVQRVHTDCPLPPTASLQGNWTHGDYVSAWAATGDHVALQAAAHSSCGMPVTAAGHSGGKGHDKTGKGGGNGHDKTLKGGGNGHGH